MRLSTEQQTVLSPGRSASPRSGEDRRAQLEALAERTRSVLSSRVERESGPVAVPWGLEEIDRTLPARGLCAGAIHELTSAREGAWPPMTAMLQLANSAQERLRPMLTVCVGLPGVWPHALAAAGLDVSRCLVINAAQDRAWAMDVALRAGALVLGDASGLDLFLTRRLQLAAESSGALALLTRSDVRTPSAAATRWSIEPLAHGMHEASGESDASHARRWRVELVRCKGAQPEAGLPRRWSVELDHEACPGRVAARVLDGSASAADGYGRVGGPPGDADARRQRA